MKIAVCDDEKYFVENIMGRLESFGIEDIFPCQFDGFTNSQEFLDHAKFKIYDLVYLDIQMEGKNGIQVAEELRKICPQCIIVFVTSYDNYVHESHRLKAFQYIEKPIDNLFFNQELKRAIHQYKSSNRSFLFHTTVGQKLIKSDSIIYLETSYDKYKLYTIGSTYYGSTKSLRTIKNEILDHYFYQLDRSTIINFKHIDTFTSTDITMINQDILSITRKRRKDFKEKYIDFMDNMD